MDTPEGQTPDIDDLLKQAATHAGRILSIGQETYLLAQLHMELLQEQEIIPPDELAFAKTALLEAEWLLLDWFEQEMRNPQAEEMLQKVPKGFPVQTFLKSLSRARRDEKLRERLVQLAMAYQPAEQQQPQPEPEELLPERVRLQIPSLYSQEGEQDPIVYVKLFTPMSTYTWFVTEFDKEDTFFGYVYCGDEGEFGYFSLEELSKVEIPVQVQMVDESGQSSVIEVGRVKAVERDTSFVPKRLSEAKAEYLKSRGTSTEEESTDG